MTHQTHAPEDNSPAGVAAPTTMVIWVHDGPVCVTIVDAPPPHVSSGICQCPACRAHDPDGALRFV